MLGVAVLAGLLAVPVACSSGPVRRPDGGEGLLAVGASAPDFAAVTASGEPIRLSSLRGHPVVAYFYPKDGTPGCTKEACAFRNAWKRYEAAHVGVIGISSDSDARHRKFMKEHELPFPLAADENNFFGERGRFGGGRAEVRCRSGCLREGRPDKGAGGAKNGVGAEASDHHGVELEGWSGDGSIR